MKGYLSHSRDNNIKNSEDSCLDFEEDVKVNLVKNIDYTKDNPL